MTDATGPVVLTSAIGRWWRRRSLRARLTVAATAVIALGMAAAAALLLWRLHAGMLDNLDAALTRQVNAAAEDVARGDPSPQLPDAGDNSAAVQVIDAGGRVINSSANIDGEPRLFFTPAPSGAPALDTVVMPAFDEAFRVAALSAPSPSGPVTIYVGSPTTAVSTSATVLGAELIVGVPVLIVALGGVGWWLLGRALSPVETMRRQAAAIPGTDLRRRLDVPPARDEVGRLAVTLNELLTRIETTVERQRRFVADAAHELRSPLAALRARMEIDARQAETRSAVGTAAALRQVEHLSDLVDGLLQLARLDAQSPLQRQPVDLDDLVWQAVTEARELGPPDIDTTGIGPVRILGDAPALRRVVRNLLSNARRHARTTITVRLQPAASPAKATATLTVADDGAGIAASDRQRVFERFVRLDVARTRDAGGAGLGLAIVADIVAAHGGQVWIEDNHPGARVQVRLPTLRDP